MSGHANHADRRNTTEWEFISQNLLAFDLSRFTRFLSESKRKKKRRKKEYFVFPYLCFPFFFLVGFTAETKDRTIESSL